MKYQFVFRLQVLSMILLFTASISKSAWADEVILQDSKLLVAFDSSTGALIRMENKTTNWKIMRRPELGVSFRMLVPMPDRRMNYVLGQKQLATKVEKSSDTKVVITWKNLKSEFGGTLPITMTATVTLQDGALTFGAALENNSSLSIETIDYPYFGDFNAPAKNTSLHARTMWYGNLQSEEIYPNFSNAKGYWGVFYPTKTLDSNRSLFCLIQSPDQGLYVEMHDPTQKYLLQYTFEQHPGVISGITNTVPKEDKIAGLPVHLEFRTCHFIFAHPNSQVNLVPVVIRSYKGDWHAGVDYYKQWRTTWFKQPHIPSWIKEVNSWLQLQINSPEQDYRVPYNKLLQYGKECADNGVGAIQLVGWNFEGQDGGDPVQDIDPGLGTREDLVKAVADIQKLGVKMIMFGKLNWADKSTEAYKKEFYKYAATDPFGVPYEQGGYSYYTPTQLAGINNHRRAVMDFQDPEFRNAATNEFKKLLGLGASGWLFDENCHHGPVKYSFATDHGYTAPGYIYGGDMPLASQLRDAADKVSPDFLFAGEGHMDWLMQYYSCSYFRINDGSTAVDRYIDPQAPLVVAVTGTDDREMLNLILLNRYIISYEPYNFKGHVTDFPQTLAYGKKIDDLRRKYKAWIWDATFRDNLGAKVKADGGNHYSVFVTATGKRAVIVVNKEFSKAITAQVELPNPGKLVVATPENPEAQATNGTIKVPARSAAVIMEQ